MADFKEMYYTLFRAQVKAKTILEEAEKKTEAMFMGSKNHIELVDFADDKNDNKKKKE